MTLKQRAFSGLTYTGFSAGITTLVQLVQVIILANILTPTDFGLMGIVLIVVGIGQVFSDTGLSAAIIHYQHTEKKILSTLYWFNAASGIAVTLLLIAFSPLISTLFKEPSLTALISVTSVSLLIGGFGVQFKALFQRELLFKIMAVYEILYAGIYFFTAIVLAMLDFGVWSLVFGYVTAVTMSTLFIIYNGLINWRPIFYFNISIIHKYLRFGLYQLGERLITFINLKADQFIIGLLLGTQLLGYYTLAFNIIIYPVMRINQLLVQVLFPIFSKIQNESERLALAYIKTLRILSLIQAPILGGIAITASYFVPILFGVQWNESILLIQILSLYALFRTIGASSGSVILAKGRADLGFKWNLGLLFVTPPVVFWGVMYFGLSGAALALTLMHILLSFFYYHGIMKHILGEVGYSYISAVIRPVIYALFMILCIRLLQNYMLPSGLFELVSLIISGVLIYSIVIWVFEKPRITEMVELTRNHVADSRKKQQ